MGVSEDGWRTVRIVEESEDEDDENELEKLSKRI